MILLDTHIWVWWVHGDERLTKSQIENIKASETDVIGISAISCWEIAKLVEYKRLDLPCSLDKWFEQALNYPGICLFELTPGIAIDSTNLPGKFHNDPADQIIVATARVHDCVLITSDRRILQYPYVQTVG